MASHVAQSKDEWRSQFRAYRRGLSASTYAAYSALICSRTLGLPPVADARVVHVYWPQTAEGEIDTRPLIGALRGQAKTVVLPVVTSYDPAAPNMEHRRYEGPAAMSQNRWGICEPDGTGQVSPADLDLVVVPALGADRSGHRIGHGSGYYDAFLQTVAVPKVILAYENCFPTRVPADDHDVPGTHVVTEHGSIRVGSSSSSDFRGTVQT